MVTTERRTLTINQAAKELGISRNSCYAAVKAKEIPCIRIGRRLLVPAEALAKLLGERS